MRGFAIVGEDFFDGDYMQRIVLAFLGFVALYTINKLTTQNDENYFVIHNRVMHFLLGMSSGWFSGAVWLFLLSNTYKSPTLMLRIALFLGSLTGAIALCELWEHYEFLFFFNRFEIVGVYKDTMIDLQMGWLGAFPVSLFTALKQKQKSPL